MRCSFTSELMLRSGLQRIQESLGKAGQIEPIFVHLGSSNWAPRGRSLHAPTSCCETAPSCNVWNSEHGEIFLENGDTPETAAWANTNRFNWMEIKAVE